MGKVSEKRKDPLGNVMASLKTMAFRNRFYHLTLKHPGTLNLNFIPNDLWPGLADNGVALINNRFTFCGKTIENTIIPWYPPHVHEDWLVALHSFEWLRDLRSVAGDTSRRRARTMILDWIQECGRWDPLLWRPDILGRRIASWIGFYDFVCSSADENFKEEFIKSLACQAKHLLRVYPGDMDNIQHLHTLKGLLYSHICLNVSSVSEERIQTLLENEASLQIWQDGIHISRNPSIHLRALMDFIDIRNLLHVAKVNVPTLFNDMIQKMAAALKFFRHGDRKLAIFSGAQEETELMIDTALTRSGYKGKEIKSAKQSGFSKIVLGRTNIFFDVGPEGPPIKEWKSPGAFEMSLGKQRLFVNCGNTLYHSKWSDILNTTSAYSTLSIDDDDASLEGYQSMDVDPRHFDCHQTDTSFLLEMNHAGFYKKHGILHQRRFFITDNGEDIRAEDILTGNAGHTYTIRFHLHPSVKASLIQGGFEVLLQLPGKTGWRFLAGGHPLRLEESIYIGENSIPRKTLQIIIEGQTIPQTTALQWALAKESS